MKKIAILTTALLMLLATSAQADLVALYHLDGNADDGSGNGNDGIVNGGAAYVGGTFGQALSFDGINDYVDIGTANLVIGAHTVEFWAYSSSGDAEAFLEFNLDSLGFISYKDDQERVMCGHRGGVQPYTLAGTFPLNQWNHIALVYNGGDKSASASYKIYINGVDHATILPWGLIGSSFERNYIGRERNRYGNSTIDEVRIWNEARTAAQILQDYIDPAVTTEITAGDSPVNVGGAECWEITITIQGGPDDLEEVVVQGGIGADLNVTSTTQTVGNVTLTKKGGKMGATIVTWNVGSLGAGDSEEIVLTVCTGLNAQGKQEYTSAGEHDLDGGFSAIYVYDGSQYKTVETEPLTVEAVDP